MIQVKLVQSGRFELEEVAKPQVRANEVLIRVKNAGICGTDIHSFHGKHPFISTPIVPGHEFSGVIVEIGQEVPQEMFSIDQKATVEPSLVCGKCYNCQIGRYNICDHLIVLGCQTDGAFKEFISVPWQKVVPLDDFMSFEDAAMLEPLAVGIHAVEIGKVNRGDHVLVIGSGVIGLLLAQAAEVRGAIVTIVDISEERLSKAIDLGIKNVINSSKEDILTSINRISKNGIDTIFECVGHPSTILQSIEIARKGSRVVIVGVVNEDVMLPVNLIQDRELELLGDLMYTKKDFDKAKNLVAEGKVNLKDLLTKTFDLKDIQSAFEFIEQYKDTTFKVLLRV
ncbi:zinc-dependent alcohol dehydrogenase [Peribacillus sp. NPDC006672]|uniref:zinc-dependent alcohol dehydrogenase n=1 Tax=Peribacillus sp. NPDC006672 TaxID=3390606 RepID=UPI003D05F45F